MSTIKVRYLLSEKAQKRVLIETGNTPKKEQVVRFDLQELPRSSREDLVEISDDLNSANLSLQYTKLSHHKPYNLEAEENWLAFSSIEFDLVMSPQEVLAEAAAYSARLKRLLAEARPRVDAELARKEAQQAKKARLSTEAEAIFEKALSLADDEEALRKIQDSLPDEVAEFRFSLNGRMGCVKDILFGEFISPFNKAREEAKRAKEQEEQALWIEAHGSERLRMAVRNGFSAESIFASEYSSEKYPGWTLDLQNTATLGVREDPSLKELKELEAARKEFPELKVDLVKLVYFFGEDCCPCPALVARQFLGRHNLIKVLRS